MDNSPIDGAVSHAVLYPPEATFQMRRDRPADEDEGPPAKRSRVDELVARLPEIEHHPDQVWMQEILSYIDSAVDLVRMRRVSRRFEQLFPQLLESLYDRHFVSRFTGEPFAIAATIKQRMALRTDLDEGKRIWRAYSYMSEMCRLTVVSTFMVETGGMDDRSAREHMQDTVKWARGTADVIYPGRRPPFPPIMATTFYDWAGDHNAEYKIVKDTKTMPVSLLRELMHSARHHDPPFAISAESKIVRVSLSLRRSEKLFAKGRLLNGAFFFLDDFDPEVLWRSQQPTIEGEYIRITDFPRWRDIDYDIEHYPSTVDGRPPTDDYVIYSAHV